MESNRKELNQIPSVSPSPMSKLSPAYQKNLNLIKFSDFFNSCKVYNQFLSIPQIISGRIDPKKLITITQTDIKMFIGVLIKIDISVKRTFKYLQIFSSSPHKIIFPFENNKEEKIEKLVLLLLTLVYHINFSSFSIAELYKSCLSVSSIQSTIHQLIIKLYEDGHINLGHFFLFAKYIYSINEIIDETMDNTLLRRVDKGIPAIVSLFFSLYPKVMVREPQQVDFFINTFINFIKEQLEYDINLIYCVNTKTELLKMLTLLSNNNLTKETREEIFMFLSKLYSFNLKQIHFSFFFKQIKSSIINVNNLKEDTYSSGVSLISNQFELLKQIADYENRTLSNDPFYINKGFLFNGNKNNGITVTTIKGLKEEFMIIFSFTFYGSDSAKSEIPIISFNDDKTKEPLIYLYIRNDKELTLDVQKYKNRVIEYISLNKSYHIIFSTTKEGTFFSAYKFNVFINSNMKSDTIYFEKAPDLKLTIGYIDNNKCNSETFNGKIGTILIYQNSLSQESIKNMLKLKNLYFLIEEMNNKSSEEFYSFYSSRKSLMALEKIKNIKEDLSKLRLICLVSQRILWNISAFYNKIRFSDNINYIQNQYEIDYLFKVKPIARYNSTFTFKNFDMIEQFMIYEGINYITLCIEYFYNIILNMKSLQLASQM